MFLSLVLVNAKNKKSPPSMTEDSHLNGVGVARFELATSCSQSRRDNRATLHPETGFFISTFRSAIFPTSCRGTITGGVYPASGGTTPRTLKVCKGKN